METKLLQQKKRVIGTFWSYFQNVKKIKRIPK
jgi:hypothetical protein